MRLCWWHGLAQYLTQAREEDFSVTGFTIVLTLVSIVFPALQKLLTHSQDEQSMSSITSSSKIHEYLSQSMYTTTSILYKYNYFH